MVEKGRVTRDAIYERTLIGKSFKEFSQKLYFSCRNENGDSEPHYYYSYVVDVPVTLLLFTRVGEIVITALSFVIMFLYIGVALGRLRPAPDERFHSFGARFRAILSRLKFGLGLAGILVFVCALGIAVGLCAMFGLKATLIIAEVLCMFW